MASDTGHKVNGPHRPTLTERLVGFLRLPFVIGALILAAFLAQLGDLLGVYLDTWDLNEILARLPPGPPWFVAVQVALEVVVLFLVIWATRYLRLQVVTAEEGIVPLLPEGEEAYHSAFGRISQNGPPLLIWGPLFVFFFISAGLPPGGPFTVVFFLIVDLLEVLVAAAFIWVYLRANLGVYLLGKGSLRLKTYYEDRMLGLGPFGSLSLSLARPFLGVIAAAGVWISVSPLLLPTLGFFAGMAVLGVIMFLLPLYSVHTIMVRERDRARTSVHRQAVQWMRRADAPERKASEATPADMMTLLARLNEASFLDRAERRIDEMHAWPFDTRVVGRLAALTLTVVAVLITRYAATLFGI